MTAIVLQQSYTMLRQPFNCEPRGASPQNFEKRALTIFRLEPDRYESAHQLNCSLLLPIAMATESKALSKLFVGKSNKQQISAAIDRQHGFWKTTETN